MVCDQLAANGITLRIAHAAKPLITNGDEDGHPPEGASDNSNRHGWTCSFDKSTVPSFDNAVLLWSSWNSLLMKNSYLFIMVIQSFVDKFCAIVGADESYSFVETDLNLLQKFDDNCRGFIL
ncbi:hypothetical protein Tco_1343601 [Tanacetum coccineum]